MKTNEILIIGGVGLVLMMAFQKKAQAAAIAAAQARGGGPQPGVAYATPTAQNGVIAGAVNGILNWISGTPKTSTVQGNVSTPGGTVALGGGVGDVFGNPVDSLSDLWDRTVNNINSTWGGNDGSVTGSSNVQNGSQLQIPSLASFWTSGSGGLE
jgi:hypothetical protein